MYKATHTLSTENVEMDVKVHFVIYSIDTSMEVPHLKFYLVKDCEDPPEDLVTSAGETTLQELAHLDNYLRQHEYLTFPSIDYDATQHFLFTLYCQGVVESLFHEDRQYVKYLQHRGHLVDEYERQAFAFFELTPTTTEAEYMTRETFIWPVLMDEILHKNGVCDIPIHSEVTSFFVEHPSFIYLSRVLDTDSQATEVEDDATEMETPVEEWISTMPVCVYFPVPSNLKQTSPGSMDVQKRTQFTAMFGVTRTEEHGSFVFYSYHRALDILREEGSTKQGLVRLALNPGKITIDQEEFALHADIETFYHGNEYHAKRYEQQKPMSYHHLVNQAQL
jgi:hypothetical protein